MNNLPPLLPGQRPANASQNSPSVATAVSAASSQRSVSVDIYPKSYKWTVAEVAEWISSVGYPSAVVKKFIDFKVTGHLLLSISDKELEELGFGTLHRRDFFDKLDKLKGQTDYANIDLHGMKKWLCAIDPKYIKYVYECCVKDVSVRALVMALKKRGEEEVEKLLIMAGISNYVHLLKIGAKIRDMPAEVLAYYS